MRSLVPLANAIAPTLAIGVGMKRFVLVPMPDVDPPVAFWGASLATRSALCDTTLNAFAKLAVSAAQRLKASDASAELAHLRRLAAVTELVPALFNVLDVRQPPSGDLKSMERLMIDEALQSARFNKSQAAQNLGLTRSQLYVRMRRYGLD